jgi:hypothetical protein
VTDVVKLIIADLVKMTPESSRDEMETFKGSHDGSRSLSEEPAFPAL